MVRETQTRINKDKMQIIHFIYGLLASYLSLEIPLTMIYVVKQYIDFQNDELPEVTCGDLVIYAIGIISFALLKRLVFHQI